MEARRRQNTLRRLVRLWAAHARLDLLWVTRDLKVFLTWAFADSFVHVAGIAGLLLLAERFAGIGQWTQAQMVFLLGYATTVAGLMDVFCGYNIAFISRRLGRGQLDHSLIQPQPLWMSLLTEGFCPLSGLPALLPGSILLAWGMSRLPFAPTPLWLAMLGLSLLASLTVYVAFQFLWGSAAFWAPRAAEEINSSTSSLLYELRPFPLDNVGVLLQGGLLTFLPVGFLAWFPCRALLGLETAPWSVWVTPLAALLFALAAYGMFQKGLRHYERTGSQRYSAFGHRG